VDAVTSNGQAHQGWFKREVPECGGSSDLHLRTLDAPLLELLSTELVTAYKRYQLASMRYPATSSLLNPHAPHECYSYVNPHISQKGGRQCLAVVFLQDLHFTQNLLRFDSNPKKKKPSSSSSGSITSLQLTVGEEKLDDHPTGFFSKVGSEKGRSRLSQKMKQLFKNLPLIESHVQMTLHSHGFLAHERDHNTITVMVVNQGELDLLVNFVCSCVHHNISTSNVLVFAGSANIVPLIDAMGLMAVFHVAFAPVSKEASYEYLDGIFVDMMWYKAFSVWLLLKLGFSVLFQDVDLVWFKSPFSFFDEAMDTARATTTSTTTVAAPRAVPEAFFSDDGQRGLRYSPFYANSGFYYLAANDRTAYFAYTIMTAFDTLQVTGSHQNVFTTRLIEGMDLARISPMLLSLDLFPTGVKYHHDKPFMLGIREGLEHPYNFHMCWTLNKQNKIDYFQKANMWFVKSHSQSQPPTQSQSQSLSQTSSPPKSEEEEEEEATTTATTRRRRRLSQKADTCALNDLKTFAEWAEAGKNEWSARSATGGINTNIQSACCKAPF